MTKGQKIAILACIGIFCLIYFGLSTKAPKDTVLAASQELSPTGIENIIRSAKDSLNQGGRHYISALMNDLNKVDGNDSTKVESLIEVSSEWYKLGYPVIAGHFAEEVATLRNTAESWGIAGTTYFLGLKNASAEKEAKYAKNKAVLALEKAISLDPDNIDYKINHALIMVDFPDEGPMQGILMLRELNEKNPDNVSVLNQLAKLAIRTSQWDKAIARLSHALTVDPDNKTATCLIAQAYQGKGDLSSAEPFFKKCNN